MGREEFAVEVGDGDPAVVPAGLVDVLGDVGPDDALGGVVGAAWFPTHAEYCPDRGVDCVLVAADDDDGGSAVPGDVGTGGVRDQSQVLVSKEVLDDLGTEFALHER